MGSPIIPNQVLHEAIQTLNLLFPVSDPGSEKVLMRQDLKVRFHVDEPYGGPRRLNLFDYNVWRDRLLEPYEDIYQSPPASWTQLWKDDRNPQQFWTFWIALFILLLTVVSTIATVWHRVFSVLAYYRPPLLWAVVLSAAIAMESAGGINSHPGLATQQGLAYAAQDLVVALVPGSIRFSCLWA